MLPWLKAASAGLALAAGIERADQGRRPDLVRVFATVKNPAGELVGALNKEDFEILDNGVPQQIAVFERQTAQPLSVALMVDASGSTAKDLKYEVDSVARFFKALFAEGNPKDARGALQLQLSGDAAQLLHPQSGAAGTFAAS